MGFSINIISEVFLQIKILVIMILTLFKANSYKMSKIKKGV